MMMKTRHRVGIGMVGLLLCGVASGSAEPSASKDWKALCGKNIQLGLDAERVNQMVGHCRKMGLSTRDAEKLLAPVIAAGEEALPTECVFIKIEEGLAKQVDAARITAAAEARLECLRKARKLLSANSSGRGGGGPPHLITRICIVLESGLPEEVLQEIFTRPGGFRYGRLVQVLGAAETLHLAGLDPKNTQQIMNDCLDRNLNRSEVLRVVDYVVAEHRKGSDFKAIHAGLWVRSD
ncbi:MAG: hypothetical protein HN423_02620 [Alphaproteobacteria bacterium]|nr:hypothetical protein [Alphaproteobacteria bacterium]